MKLLLDEVDKNLPYQQNLTALNGFATFNIMFYNHFDYQLS